jgi:hypothetical protein
MAESSTETTSAAKMKGRASLDALLVEQKHRQSGSENACKSVPV